MILICCGVEIMINVMKVVTQAMWEHRNDFGSFLRRSRNQSHKSSHMTKIET